MQAQQAGTREEVPVEASYPVVEVEAIQKDTNQIYTVVQQQPVFPGGQIAMAEFLRQNFNYPKRAHKKGIQGRVYVKFVVTKTGEVKDVTLIKGMDNCDECNQEALRIVRIMPKWIPGLQNGKPISVYYSLPIIFKIKQ